MFNDSKVITKTGWTNLLCLSLQPSNIHFTKVPLYRSQEYVRGTCLLKKYCIPALFIAENDRRSIDRLTHWHTHTIDIEQNTIVILSVSQSSEFCHTLVCSFATVQFKCLKSSSVTVKVTWLESASKWLTTRRRRMYLTRLRLGGMWLTTTTW